MEGGAIQGLGYLAVEVRDLDIARDFYADTLGLEALGEDCWPDAAASRLMAAGGQHVVLVHNPDGAASPEGGTHQAYRVAKAAREAIAGRLRAQGFAVETYYESRPAEAADNFYFQDPSGNRVQLVTQGDGTGGPASVEGIDHACVEDFDLEWTEQFYAGVLGLPVAYWHGLRTEDYLGAREWAADQRAMAPGCCRMVRYYRKMPGHDPMQPRPTLQLYLQAGADFVGIYMTMEDYAEPPEEQLRGSPCLGFRVTPGRLKGIARTLEGAGRPFLGPIAKGDGAPFGTTIYCKDTGGNFLAFTESP